MTIKHLFPVSKPTLDLNFAATRELDPRITFTRSSTGTYTDANGIVRTAAADEPRFDHDGGTGESLGLLIEGRSTNYLPHSTNFSASDWTFDARGAGSQIPVCTNDFAVAPDGTTTAARMVCDKGTAADTHSNWSWITAKRGGGTKQVNSIWVKSNTSNDQIISYNSTHDIVATQSWKRLTGVRGNMRIGCFRGSAQIVDILIWGAQVEDGDLDNGCSTSYIPTAGSAATRAADLASITGTSFNSWYNQSEGTYVAKFRSKYPDCEDITVMQSGSRIFALTDVNRVQFWYGATSAYSNNGTSGYPAASTFSRAALFYTDDGANHTVGGSFQGFPAVSASGTGAVSNTELKLAPSTDAGGTGAASTAHLARIAYYSRRLPDEQLIALSS